MRINDPVPSFPVRGARTDPFDLLDLTSDLLFEAFQLAARRRLRPCDIAGLLDAIAALIEARVDGEKEDISLHYLAARLRESANNRLD